MSKKKTQKDETQTTEGRNKGENSSTSSDGTSKGSNDTKIGKNDPKGPRMNEEKVKGKKNGDILNVTKGKDDGVAQSSGKGAIDSLFAAKKQTVDKRKAEESAAKAKHEKKRRMEKQSLKGDRNDVANLTSGEWVDDGLGGVFNKEGYTGRKDKDGMKVFKAHLFNQSTFGNTPLCPFDCKCCYI